MAPTTVSEEIPKRSLASLRVIAALMVSTLLLCAVGWYSKHGDEKIDWIALKQIILKLCDSSEETEDDLPYVTAKPMVPLLGTPVPIDDELREQSQAPERVVLSELIGSEQPGEDDSSRTQRR